MKRLSGRSRLASILLLLAASVSLLGAARPTADQRAEQVLGGSKAAVH